MRAIIREAGVNLNSVHYHFGSKAEVTKAVCASLLESLNEERVRLLESARNDGPTIENLIAALYWPVFRRAGLATTSQARRELQIVAQLRCDPSADARAILAEHQESFGPEFEALLEVATGVSEPEFRLAIRFINAIAWGVVSTPVLVDDLLDSDDRAGALRSRFEEFLAFSVAGLERLTNPTNVVR